MATYYKKSANATLNLNTAWSATGSGGADNAGPPGAADIAYWQAGSLGAALTGSISPQGIQIDGALTDIAHSSGTITLGTSGITFAATNNRVFAFNGTVNVGTNNQTWALSRTGAAASITFSTGASSLLAGSATINLTSAVPGTAQYLFSQSTVSTFTGTIIANNDVNIGIAGASGQLGTSAARLRFVGTNSSFYPGGNTTFASNLDVWTPTGQAFVLGGAAGTMTFSGPVDFSTYTPTLSVANSVTISGPITGTAGFTKAGAGGLTISGNLSGLSGTISQNQTTSGYLIWGAGHTPPTNAVVSVTGPGADEGGRYFGIYTPASYAYSAGLSFTGTGLVELIPPAGGATGAGAQFESGSLVGLTGTSTPASVSYLTPTCGLSTALISGRNTQIVTVKDLPAGVFSHWTYSNSAGATYNSTLYYANTGAVHSYGTRFDLVTGFTASGTFNYALYANQGSGPLILTGDVQRWEQAGQSRTVTLTLRGSTLGVDNQISGAITQQGPGSGVLAITKADSNRWILSGTNTYTGSNTVSAGTLVANNNSALGAAAGAASSITTGATLEIASGITVNKASAQWTLNGNTAANGAVYAPSGNAGLTAANFVLGTATTDIKADAGATLTLTSAGAISGNFTLRHVGTGTAVLAQTAASTFTALNIQSGTVSVSAALAAGGAPSGIGNGSTAASNWLIGSTATAGTFRYTGAVSSTNRNFTIGTAGSTFDASGSGVLTLTGTTPAFSAANTACTLTLAGMSGSVAAPNTSAMVLPDNTQPVGLTKIGAGAWELSASQTYTGTTTITGGSLSFNENNIATNVVFNGPGTLRKVVLNGVSKTITCSAGASDVAELIATSSHNTITGSTNITTGTLKLTTEATAATKPVKVTGDTNVVVTSKLQTSTGILQRGQMRYGGNLTFQAGSTFIIGG